MEAGKSTGESSRASPAPEVIDLTSDTPPESLTDSSDSVNVDHHEDELAHDAEYCVPDPPPNSPEPLYAPVNPSLADPRLARRAVSTIDTSAVPAKQRRLDTRESGLFPLAEYLEPLTDADYREFEMLYSLTGGIASINGEGPLFQDEIVEQLLSQLEEDKNGTSTASTSDVGSTPRLAIEGPLISGVEGSSRENFNLETPSLPQPVDEHLDGEDQDGEGDQTTNEKRNKCEQEFRKKASNNDQPENEKKE